MNVLLIRSNEMELILIIPIQSKEVCNRGVACSLLKLDGSYYKIPYIQIACKVTLFSNL